jgi:hypothetical protein
VPELAGCMADGATRQDALANAEVVIAEWLETAGQLGRPIPGASECSVKPKKSAFGLLARYGPGPTEEEIDANRREMFSER